MNNKILLLVPLIMVLALQGVANAQLSPGDDALSVANLAMMPNPIIAGNNVTMVFQLYNSYQFELNNVNLQIEGEYPIVNVSPYSTYLTSSIGEGLYNTPGSYFVYKLSIPKTTPSGVYTINLVANYETESSSTTQVGTVSEVVTGQSIIPITFYVHGIPNVTATAASQSIVPGSQFPISISLANSGYGEAENVSVQFLNTSQFKVSGSEALSIGALEPGSTISTTATYQASSSVLNGTYDIPLLVSYKSDTGVWYNSTQYAKLSVVVDNPDVVVALAGSYPEALYSGYNQTVDIAIENIGTGTAKNVSVSLSGVNGASITGSVNEFFIGSLAPGQSVAETLLVSAYNSGNSTVAGISSRAAYYTSNYGYLLHSNQTLSLALAQASQFKITNVTANLAPGSTDEPVTFRIENIGNIDAQQVQLSLQSPYPITPLAGTYYIPNLAPGQSANVTFLVSVDSEGVAASYPILLFEQWKQPNGSTSQLYSGSTDYYVPVQSSTGLPSWAWDIIGLVVVVLIAVVAYRRVSKRKKAGRAKKES